MFSLRDRRFSGSHLEQDRRRISNLFKGNVIGAWYCPSDLKSLFQDSARTTGVSSIGDPIGCLMDLSGQGNHAIQATSAARPIYDNISTTLGLEYQIVPRIKHDFVDDKLFWTGVTGTYNIAVCNISEIQFYTAKLIQTTGSIPIVDLVGMIILNRSFTDIEKKNITHYFNALFPISLASGFKFECNATSYIGRGGTSTGNILWTFGGGTILTTMFSSTQPTRKRESLTFSSEPYTALTIFYCHSNQLTGSIPNLSANTALTIFYCQSNQLTGSIPTLSANTALTTFSCPTNQLTGSIPTLSANTALTDFYCHSNQLTGSIPTLSANTALTTFYCHTNQLSSWTDGIVSSTVGDFQAQNNNLSAAAINAILAAFVAANKITGTRILNIGGTGNAAPTGQGITDKATLQSRGWTVTTN